MQNKNRYTVLTSTVGAWNKVVAASTSSGVETLGLYEGHVNGRSSHRLFSLFAGLLADINTGLLTQNFRSHFDRLTCWLREN